MRTASSRAKKLPGPSAARWRRWLRARSASVGKLPNDCARGLAIDNGLFPEAQHRQSTFERGTPVGARTWPEANRLISGVRAAVAGIGTCAVPRIGEAPRLRRATSASAWHGGVLRAQFSLRQARTGAET